MLFRSAFRQGPRIETVDGRKILFAHSYNQLQGELSGQGRFDLVLFGHTHRPYLKADEGRLYVNPGSPTQPLIARPSVAVLTIAGGSVSAEIVYF